jgi:hypothetical protein
MGAVNYTDLKPSDAIVPENSVSSMINCISNMVNKHAPRLYREYEMERSEARRIVPDMDGLKADVAEEFGVDVEDMALETYRYKPDEFTAHCALAMVIRLNYKITVAEMAFEVGREYTAMCNAWQKAKKRYGNDQWFTDKVDKFLG